MLPKKLYFEWSPLWHTYCHRFLTCIWHSFRHIKVMHGLHFKFPLWSGTCGWGTREDKERRRGEDEMRRGEELIWNHNNPHLPGKEMPNHKWRNMTSAWCNAIATQWPAASEGNICQRCSATSHCVASWQLATAGPVKSQKLCQFCPCRKKLLRIATAWDHSDFLAKASINALAKRLKAMKKKQVIHVLMRNHQLYMMHVINNIDVKMM